LRAQRRPAGPRLEVVPQSRGSRRVAERTAANSAERPTANNAKGTQTRARLLLAAKAVFEDKGYESARISDFTAKAGISHGSFYHYFPTKEAAFLQLVEDLDTHLGEPLDSVIFRADSTLPPAERIRAGIGEHLRTYQQEAQFLRVIEEYSGYDEKFAARRFDQRRSSMQSVIASIEQLQRRGLADPDLDARVTIPALCEMINGLANAWLVRQRLALSLDHAVDQLATLWANTLGLTR